MRNRCWGEGPTVIKHWGFESDSARLTHSVTVTLLQDSSLRDRQQEGKPSRGGGDSAPGHGSGYSWCFSPWFRNSGLFSSPGCQVVSPGHRSGCGPAQHPLMAPCPRLCMAVRLAALDGVPGRRLRRRTHSGHHRRPADVLTGLVGVAYTQSSEVQRRAFPLLSSQLWT